MHVASDSEIPAVWANSHVIGNWWPAAGFCHHRGAGLSWWAARRLLAHQPDDVGTHAPVPRAAIQNGGVDRMSGMSSILHIRLYRDVPSHHEPKW